MTIARSTLVNTEVTPYYHCMARCVRRAFLCGKDHLSGKNYEHRKVWVEERLGVLTSVFAIEVCAYAVMSNHYHVVLCVDNTRGSQWTDHEVLSRWQQLYSAPLLVQRYLAHEVLSKEEQIQVTEYAATIRQRLQDISWFMRCLNEHLARKANKEDKCKGRFWEGRFKSQALLDEAAVLTCMAYVDLNPVRAGISKTPEASHFTSIRVRIKKQQAIQAKTNTASNTVPLKPLRAKGVAKSTALPFSYKDYLQLVDWTGRAIRSDKKQAINNTLPDILYRTGINKTAWLTFMQPKGNTFKRAIGRLTSLVTYNKVLGTKWLHGIKASIALFPASMPV